MAAVAMMKGMKQRRWPRSAPDRPRAPVSAAAGGVAKDKRGVARPMGVANHQEGRD